MHHDASSEPSSESNCVLLDRVRGHRCLYLRRHGIVAGLHECKDTAADHVLQPSLPPGQWEFDVEYPVSTPQ